jgi:uncharacterized protein (DUF58 family)
MSAWDSPRPREVADGLRPTLAELVALRGLTRRQPPPRRGRHGLAGVAPAIQRGRGMEYAESREYVSGDDARHIDWRVTARTGRAHTKLFQSERERLSLIVADTVPPLYFGTRVRYKSMQAARAGALAAWMAQRQGDRVAALRGCTSEPPVAPASGTRGVMRVLAALVRWYAQPPADDAGLETALEHAARLLRPGSRLTVLADPRSAAAVPLSRWAGLALHHEVNVLLLVDPLELSPPAQALTFQAAAQRYQFDLSSASARQQWQQEFLGPLRMLMTQLPARRINTHVLSCADASDAWIGTGVAETRL